MATKVDLSQLAIERDLPPSVKVATRRNWRGMVTRYMLPLALLAGFVALLIFAAWDRLNPPRSVTVMPVISSQSISNQAADTPIFRAVGWVEPRPTPTIVTALAEGVVDELLVVEGQEVKKGDIVAKLILTDAKISLDSAIADVQLREADVSAAAATLTAAKARFDGPLHLQIEVADASAALAKVEAEFGNLSFLLRGAQARQRFAHEEFDVNKRTTGTVSALAVQRSKSDLEAADAVVEEIQARQKSLPVEIAALKEKRDALLQKLNLKTDELRQVGEAVAAEQSAKARLSQAQSNCDAARLRLSRMEIRAPSAGRVLALAARPGSRLMGQDPRALQDSSSVVLLYDPASLQVRVDVRLDDVGKVIPGQKATIESAALPGTQLEGRVLATNSQADIQKNTLPVKVAIVNPPSNLKPEMLCQVVFLAPPRVEKPTKKDSDSYRLFVPKQLVDTSGDGSRVWLVDLSSGKADHRTIQTGVASGELIEVVSGLSPTDRLIVGGRDGLHGGQRVAVTSEDESLGMSIVGGRTK